MAIQGDSDASIVEISGSETHTAGIKEPSLGLIERAADIKRQLTAELRPAGILDQILVGAMAHSAAGMAVGASAEAATLDFAGRNAAAMRLMGAVSTRESVLVAAIASDNVGRATRYRCQHERAFFSALRAWDARERSAAQEAQLSLFGSEDACEKYLTQWQADQSWCCSSCGGRERWPLRGRAKYECRCGQQLSVREGTLFARSRVPLLAWFDLTTLLVIRPDRQIKDLSQRVRVVRMATLRQMTKKVRAALAAPSANEQLAGLPDFIEMHLRQVYVRPAPQNLDRHPSDRPRDEDCSSVFAAEVKEPYLPRRPR